MPSTLQPAIEVIKPVKAVRPTPAIVDQLLGSFKGIIPADKTSTQHISEMREYCRCAEEKGIR